LSDQQKRFGPAIETWIKFMRAHAAVTRELSARLEAQHGLTLNDYDVLVQLYFAEGRRLRRVDLARTVLLTASGVGKERCESDARVTYAVLTKAGLAKFEEAQCSHVRDIEELFASRFSHDEIAVIGTLLDQLPLAEASACGVPDE
jgi:DNA-binding MarR family transcriptional regulator